MFWGGGFWSPKLRESQHFPFNSFLPPWTFFPFSLSTIAFSHHQPFPPLASSHFPPLHSLFLLLPPQRQQLLYRKLPLLFPLLLPSPSTDVGVSTHRSLHQLRYQVTSNFLHQVTHLSFFPLVHLPPFPLFSCM